VSAPAIWLLPGMDGTGSLFGALREALGADRVVRVFSYAPELARYDAILESLPTPDEPVVLVAESFGGPLAVRLAARAPQHVRHLVLAASFVRAPRALPAALVAALLRVAPRPPALAVRRSLASLDTPPTLIAEVRAAIAATPRATLAARMHEVLTVDIRAALASLEMPVTCIVATQDRLVPDGAAREPAMLARRGTIVSLDAPHLVLQVRARAAASVIAAAAGT
jgi:pimeloyl-[acyl-carrier protein] methyl ester esterase